jgi:predicted nucleic acid-binding protein
VKLFLDANICLDLLDSQRVTSAETIAWYMEQKDDTSLTFYFSADFITTFYYILTERRKHDASNVVATIEALSFEIFPWYLVHSDFISAKEDFAQGVFSDFEDLMVLNAADRCECTLFITHDKQLLEMKEFKGMKIHSVLEKRV